jgi:hypothetical protein
LDPHFFFSSLPPPPPLERIRPSGTYKYFRHSSTSWTGDRPIARPLLTQDSTNIGSADLIHAPSGMVTHDPRVLAAEDITLFGTRSHRNRFFFSSLLESHLLDINWCRMERCWSEFAGSEWVQWW